MGLGAIRAKESDSIGFRGIRVKETDSVGVTGTLGISPGIWLERPTLPPGVFGKECAALTKHKR